MRNTLLLFLYLSSIYAIHPVENTNFIRSKNFSHEDMGISPEDTAGYHELKIWANFQMLEVLPDDPGYGLKDGVCRFVPKEGLEFLLTANPDAKKTIYLFLDFALFRPMSKFSGTLNHSLKIYLNGRQKEIMYYAKSGLVSPKIIKIDPSELNGGKLAIRLESDAVEGRFWCIWDAYYSYERY